MPSTDPAPTPADTTTSGPGEETAVDGALAAAGIRVSPDDRRQLLAQYAASRPAVAALYDLPEVRYEVPALVFQAEPKLQPWGT